MQSSRSSAFCVIEPGDRCAHLMVLEEARPDGGPHRHRHSARGQGPRALAWTAHQVTGLVLMTPEDLYGHRKMLFLLRRQTGLAGAPRGAVDRAMHTLGLEDVRRAKEIRTTTPGRTVKC